MSKQIIVLGSTGSIGTQTLNVIENLNYNVFGLSVYSDVELLLKQIIKYKPKYVCVVNENAYEKLKISLNNQKNAPILLKGKQGLVQLVSMEGADIVLNSISGIAGLESTLATVKHGKTLALANKESLVAGGNLVKKEAFKNNAKILPVDSEHSAIFQCIQDKHSAKAIDKLLLTASGGPFFGYNKEQLMKVKKEDALKHPNWDMGNKITIDSASLMNKGLELIEAVRLFDISHKDIEIVVQRQSIIHSMVQFADNAILAQLGTPDMSVPIQYALTYPNRFKSPAEKIDFTKLKSITFDVADESLFRCLPACKLAIEKDGLAPCAVNGANEMAVELFLKDKISFLQIGEFVEKVAEEIKGGQEYSLQDILDCDKWAREKVLSFCQ